MFFDPATRVLLRTRPSPLTWDQARLLRGARPAGPPPRPSAEPVTVQRGPATPASSWSSGRRSPSAVSTPGQVVTVHVAADTITIDLATTTPAPSGGPPPSQSAASKPSSPARLPHVS